LRLIVVLLRFFLCSALSQILISELLSRRNPGQGPQTEIDQTRSNLPDSLALTLIHQPFQAEPKTTGTFWILIDGSYENLENSLVR